MSLDINTDAARELVRAINMEQTRVKSAADQGQRQREALLLTLEALGKLNVGDDGLVFEGSRFVLPEQYRDNVEGAQEFLGRYVRQQEKEHEFSRVFNFRPWDGAAAFSRALHRVFGHAGIGQTTYGFFGSKHPPKMISIEVGVGKNMQVPWGEVRVEQLQATFVLGASRDRELGPLFGLSVVAPRKYRAHLEAFFDQVQVELTERSIYKGQAVTGAENPGFMNLSTVDPAKVIYSREVITQLGANFWTLIEQADLMRELGVPLKRSILVSGPYGSGKTLAGMLTAQRAVDHGFTYIMCRTGKDDLFRVLSTAQLYAPAVVWFEDIDVLTAKADEEEIAKVLDALDGLGNKGVEVLAGFTTNHVNRIPQGVLRPGRIDSVIPIEGLDREGIEKLVKAVIPGHLLSDQVDYDRLYAAFDGYMPAFYREAIDRSVRYVINRTGQADMITTDDLVDAADGLRPQHQLMLEAEEGVRKPTLSGVLSDTITETLRERLTVGGEWDFEEKEKE